MEPTDHNIRAFDQAHRRPPEERGLPELVRGWLPDLDGKHVLHLGCGTGEETVDLAALGALVTGVDPIPEALEVARRRDPSIAWVQSEPHDLPLELRRGRFHLVYARAEGVRDLGGFARAIEDALRPGGYLLLHEEHPVLTCLDPLLRWRASYFEERVGLGRLLTALAQAGLVLRRLEEYPAPEASRVPGSLVLVARKPGA